MRKIFIGLFAVLIAAFLGGNFANAETTTNTTKTRKEMVDEKAKNPDEYKLLLELKDGTVEIELLPMVAPNHVARIKELTRKGFYDGIIFHRVIDGFMAQTGDPTGTGMSGSGKNLKAEFNAEAHTRGAVSMARAQSPDSADSQFFVVLEDSNFLDKQYTVWGRVLSGMEFVDNITKGEPPRNPDKIVSMKVKADVAGKNAKGSEQKAEAKTSAKTAKKPTKKAAVK
jgi:peptidylprolyl isomerase